MSTESSNQPPDAERIARLERSMRWLKVGFVIVIIALITLLVPPIGNAIGLLLLVCAIAGGVIVLIATTAYILDRTFPNAGPKK